MFTWQSRVGNAGAVEHAHVIAGNCSKTGRVLLSNQREAGQQHAVTVLFSIHCLDGNDADRAG